MKICCCSRSYARALQSGDLTQLEWVDRCAGLALDGVDFASAHFPRTDDDYLAQIRKLCVDRGLTIAALTFDGEVGGDSDVDAQASLVASWIERARMIGAPLLRIACGVSSGSPGIAWRELIRAFKSIAHAGKASNVTIALEPRAGSLVSTTSDCKRALKESDSAWLRLAHQLAGPTPTSYDEEVLLGEVVIAISRGDDTDASRMLRKSGFIGFTTIETSGADEDVSVSEALGRLRMTGAI